MDAFSADSPHPGSLRSPPSPSKGRKLYIPTRYPTGLPGGVPAEVFTEEQAAEAIAQATQFAEQPAALMRQSSG